MDTYYKIGGCLHPNHLTYVTRKADRELFEYLKQGEYCYILNSRQMGKSSLRVKTAKKLRAEGVKCAFIDITLIGSLVTPAQWYQGFANLLLDSLQLDTEFDFNSFWNRYNSLPEVQKIYKFIELILLKLISNNLVIFIDEIDSLIKVNFKDDFFAFIRACYNQRAENSEFNRLCFCLLGVASPTDLIQDKARTPFNIGHSIDLTGLTFSESKTALLPGLASKFEQPENLLKEILYWTGGQPFLTQKLCSLVLQKSNFISPNVKEIVNHCIIQNWEYQDEPEHLRTIRDRLMYDEDKTINLLSLYQQILLKKSIQFENSDEQSELRLRLTGLIVKDSNLLTVYNPIYEAVFNLDWLNDQLENKRPYSNALKAWLHSNREQAFLLQGKTLEKSQKWATGKNLSNLDYQFLAVSQAEQDRKENRILEQANKKARKIINWTVITAFGIITATTLYTQHQINTAQKIIQLEKAGNDIQQRFESQPIEGLISAIKAGQTLKTIVNEKQPLSDYPTLNPISALLNTLHQITVKNQFQLKGHQKKIKNIDFSPDGKMIASGDIDGIIKLWLSDGTSIKISQPLKYEREFKNNSEISKANSEIYDLKFSPDSQIIAAVSDDGTVSLWRKDGTLIRRIKTLNEEELQKNYRVYTIEFSPDGKLLASASTDGIIKLWKIEGNLFKKLQQKNNDRSLRIYSLAFSSNSRLIASGGEDGKIRIWRLDGTLARVIEAHQGGINNIIFSPDGQFVASGGEDGIINVWRLNGQSVQTFKTDDRISYLNFSPDGKIITSANTEGTIKLWTLKKKEPEQTLTGNKARVYSIRFGQDGKTLISASQDGTIRTWQITFPSTKQKPITSIAFSQDGNLTALGKEDGTIKLKTKDNTRILNTNSQEGSEIKDIFFHPDRQTFYTTRWDGVIQHWNTQGTLLKTLMEYPGNIVDAAFNPIDQTIAIVNDEGAVKRLTLSGKLGETLLSKDYQITRIAFHSDGKTLAFASRDNSVNLWQDGGKTITYIEGSKNPITDLNFSQDGRLLAASYTDGTIKLWQMDGSPLLTLTGQGEDIKSIGFSSDGKTLGIAHHDGSISFLQLTLDGLLKQGCSWLKDYLKSHPPVAEDLKVCRSILR